MARNKITIGSVTELLNDARLPASLGTAGQVLKMNTGATGIEWGEAGGGDTHLYLHSLKFQFFQQDTVNRYNKLGEVCMVLYTTSPTPFTESTIISFIYSILGSERLYGVNGTAYGYNTSTSTSEVPGYVTSVYASSASLLNVTWDPYSKIESFMNQTAADMNSSQLYAMNDNVSQLL